MSPVPSLVESLISLEEPLESVVVTVTVADELVPFILEINAWAVVPIGTPDI